MAEPAILRQWLDGVEQRLADSPADVALQLRRADLLRAQGDLDRAACAYAALAGSGEAATRALTVLAGEPATWPDAAGPVPFVRLHGFLGADRQEDLWRAVADPAARFGSAGVYRGTTARRDPTIRQADRLRGVEPVRVWFLPLIDAVLAADAILPRLGLAPFDVGLRELQVTSHEEGGFYRSHRDSGPATPLRRLTYVYYFHREPRRFSGGDLLLFDQTPAGGRSDGVAFTRLEPVHNSLVFFPADRLHAVTRVLGAGADPMDRRWTVNGWLNQADSPQASVPQ